MKCSRAGKDPVEVSEVSGTTDFDYNEHGELETRTDARGVVMTRTLDELDRVSFEDYPDDTLDVTYTYDDPMVAFSLGRLTKIERAGEAIDYAYDRFGRVTQDGDLSYVYDDNGNRLSIGYPDSVSAIYTYDAADRQSTLTVEVPGEPDASVVTASSYEPAGPLASVTLGNGLTETWSFDTRYYPGAIQVDGASPVLDWTYTTDDAGNIAGIGDVLDPANDRTYGYQDYQYYLTQGDGPWGDLSWTYDFIGNRLSETRDGVADTYTYVANAASGNSARLDEIQLGAGGTTIFAYDAAGNQTQVDSGGDVVDRTYDDAGRMSRQERASAGASTDFLYDGRSYLRDAAGVVPDPSAGVFCDGFETGDTSGWDTGGVPCPLTNSLLISEPTYSSEGLLHRVASSDETSYVFYFGGRPMAQLAETAGSLSYLTTDHLGTPILASDEAGGVVWEGGFEPFGADYSGASAGGVYLRLPGQWTDGSWTASSLVVPVAYNVHRWYRSSVSHYVSPDPFQQMALAYDLGVVLLSDNLYNYVLQRPLVFTDRLGLLASDPDGCVTRWTAAGAALGAGIGATAGGTAGAAAGGTACSFVVPGVGTLGCGAGGGSAGAVPGAKIGGFIGAGVGLAVGTLVCQCEDDPPLVPPVPDPKTKKIDCRKAKAYCIARCTEETLPTNEPGGDPFFFCLRQCMDSFGC